MMSIDLDNVDTTPAPRPRTGRPATEKQIRFIADLANRRDTSGLADRIDAARVKVMAREFSSEEASALISDLLDAPKVETQRASAPEGMHYLGGKVYKVQRAVHGSGNLYAKVLRLETTEGHCGGHLEQGPSGFDAPMEYCDEQATCAQWVEGETEVTFEYAPGVVRDLGEDTLMPLEDAKKFGRLYGVCLVCGRVLTNEDSIEAGIGPVCGQRF